MQEVANRGLRKKVGKRACFARIRPNYRICYMKIQSQRVKGVKESLSKGDLDILLIHPSYHRRIGSSVIPPIGLAYLATSLGKEGFTSRILDCARYFDSLDRLTIEKMKNWLGEKLSSFNPRIAIGIGPCTTSAIRSILAISETCRIIYPDIPLIFGGPLTLIPNQEWLFFDQLKAFAVVKGDGEVPLSNLLKRLRGQKSISNIPGVQTSPKKNVKPHFAEDLDSLEFPTWNGFARGSYKLSVRRDLFVYPFSTVTGSRGCPYHCSFCVSGNLIKYRKRSFENIQKEIESLM